MIVSRSSGDRGTFAAYNLVATRSAAAQTPTLDGATRETCTLTVLASLVAGLALRDEQVQHHSSVERSRHPTREGGARCSSDGESRSHAPCAAAEHSRCNTDWPR